MKKPTWNRTDICQAWWLYSVLWHGGMSTPEYRITSRINAMGMFNPDSMWIDIEALNDNTKLIYARLVTGKSMART